MAEKTLIDAMEMCAVEVQEGFVRVTVSLYSGGGCRHRPHAQDCYKSSCAYLIDLSRFRRLTKEQRLTSVDRDFCLKLREEEPEPREETRKFGWMKEKDPRAITFVPNSEPMRQ